MLKLLQLLIFGHVHEWETEETVKLTDNFNTTIGRVYYLRCMKCGVHKVQTLCSTGI
jgi:hypothetical protein